MMMKDHAIAMFKDINNPTDEEWMIYLLSSDIKKDGLSSVFGSHAADANRYKQHMSTKEETQ